MIGHSQIVKLLAVVGVAASVAGCGRTLVFAEREGVNFAVRTNAASSTPIEVNFGLNRQVASIVPPAGEAGSRPDGDAVSMFAGFQVDNTLDVNNKPLNANMQISTQFASGKAAKAVAGNPQVVAMIVDVASGAKLAARVNSEIEIIIAAISCNGKFVVALRDKLIDAAALPPDFSSHLKTMQTADDLAASINGSPSLVRRLQNAAIKQGKATCPKP